MRRLLLAVPLLAATALCLPAAVAEPTTPEGELVQTYSGSFVAPTRFIDGASGFPGLGRKVYLAAQAADGVVADVFEVDPRAQGGAFELTEVTDATGSGQLDVFFYADLASVADGTPVTTGEFASPDKGESGFVPDGTRYAVVFSPDAVSPKFVFRASARPVVDLTALDGVVLPVGSTLGIRNDTGTYAPLRHVADRPILDRSAVGQELLAGEVVDVRLGRSGSYVFESSVGTATVTVTG